MLSVTISMQHGALPRLKCQHGALPRLKCHACVLRPGTQLCRHVCQVGKCHAGNPLSSQKCEPCEKAKAETEFMGLHNMVMDRPTADKYKEMVDPRWQIIEDSQKRLRIQRVMRTKNFTKGKSKKEAICPHTEKFRAHLQNSVGWALELFQRIGEVAEAEGHHPDLHLEGWNNVRIELWTHARDGLSENDFIMAAKIDAVPMEDLLSKKQPPM